MVVYTTGISIKLSTAATNPHAKLNLSNRSAVGDLFRYYHVLPLSPSRLCVTSVLSSASSSSSHSAPARHRRSDRHRPRQPAQLFGCSPCHPHRYTLCFSDPLLPAGTIKSTRICVNHYQINLIQCRTKREWDSDSPLRRSKLNIIQLIIISPFCKVTQHFLPFYPIFPPPVTDHKC